ncbi:transporter substrate-binding domain-containing protein [Brachybacterium sp. EF45031]|uniref:transporter substrate-binding domain-containing protein n=1 Tax=Brachybacterium sillae TaxID=2810536 RepID=UPI00217E0B98|nr:transporter substrate-binding domain-containing protein [Brachybacterium sillae]MCS6711411.1 transporter substrate-binding domain-containing protein [Brachybacterium sillae]
MTRPLDPRATRRSALALGGTSALALVLAACGPAQQRGADGQVAPASGAASDGGGSPAAEDLLQRITSTKRVRIGLEGTYRPYAFHDDSGALVGFEKEIADAIAQQLGATPEYIETEWDSLIAGLDVDKYDLVINNVGITPERQEKYLFTQPYARSVGRVAVPQDSDIRTLADLEGRRAAQSATSNWAAQMTDLGAQILPVQGFAEAMELLTAGRADATANDIVSFQTYQEEHPDAPFRLLEEELPGDTEVGIILPRGQEPLQQRLDEILTSLQEDGTLTRIYTEWTGVDLSPTA